MVFNNIKVIRHFILNANKPLHPVYCKFGIHDLTFYKYINCLSNKTISLNRLNEELFYKYINCLSNKTAVII